MGGPGKQHAPTQTPAAQSGPTTQPQHDDAQSTYGNAFVASQLASDEHAHHDHGQEPNPDASATADLDVERPVGGAIPATIRDPLMTRLRGSPRASGLMDEIIAERGNLAFPLKWSNRGSYQSGGEIWLNRAESEASWFGTMAHEMVHLLTHISGQAANARRMTREAFVNAKMEDEINAQALAYVACLQTGSNAGGAGFLEFVGWLRQNHSELTVSESDEEHEAANWREIEAHAITWLEAKYRGDWKTSNTGENYYDYWGGYWDRVNPR